MEELTRLREVFGDEHAEVIGAVEQAVERLQAAASRAVDLEAQLAEARAGAAEFQAQIEALHASGQTADRQIADLTRQMAEAAEKYRAVLLASHPDIPARLVQGTTIGEIEASLAAAQTMVAEIRRQLAAEQAAVVPNGSGGRSAADLSALSPIEKIKRGLAER